MSSTRWILFKSKAELAILIRKVLTAVMRSAVVEGISTFASRVLRLVDVDLSGAVRLYVTSVGSRRVLAFACSCLQDVFLDEFIYCIFAF